MLGVYKKQIWSYPSQLQYSAGDRFYIFDLDHNKNVNTHYLMEEADGKTNDYSMYCQN